MLSIVCAYFTIYAYDALKAELERIGHLNFLFGEPSFVNRLDPSKTEKKAFIIDATGLELFNKLQQKRVAKECADFRSHRKIPPAAAGAPDFPAKLQAAFAVAHDLKTPLRAMFADLQTIEEVRIIEGDI